MSDDQVKGFLLSRRDALRLVGACAACLVEGSPVPRSGQGALSPACLSRPEQTEGPYFVDERLNRFPPLEGVAPGLSSQQ